MGDAGYIAKLAAEVAWKEKERRRAARSPKHADKRRQRRKKKLRREAEAAKRLESRANRKPLYSGPAPRLQSGPNLLTAFMAAMLRVRKAKGER